VNGLRLVREASVVGKLLALMEVLVRLEFVFLPRRRLMPNLHRLSALVVLSTLALPACAPGEPDGEAVEAAGQPSPLAGACEPDNDGLSLPDGFCAIVFYEGTGGVRHLTVRDDGTVFVAVPDRRRGPEAGPGGVETETAEPS